MPVGAGWLVFGQRNRSGGAIGLPPSSRRRKAPPNRGEVDEGILGEGIPALRVPRSLEAAKSGNVRRSEGHCARLSKGTSRKFPQISKTFFAPRTRRIRSLRPFLGSPVHLINLAGSRTKVGRGSFLRAKALRGATARRRASDLAPKLRLTGPSC
jgi:hypothetical protein